MFADLSQCRTISHTLVLWRTWQQQRTFKDDQPRGYWWPNSESISIGDQTLSMPSDQSLRSSYRYDLTPIKREDVSIRVLSTLTLPQVWRLWPTQNWWRDCQSPLSGRCSSSWCSSRSASTPSSPSSRTLSPVFWMSSRSCESGSPGWWLPSVWRSSFSASRWQHRWVTSISVLLSVPGGERSGVLYSSNLSASLLEDSDFGFFLLPGSELPDPLIWRCWSYLVRVLYPLKTSNFLAKLHPYLLLSVHLHSPRCIWQGGRYIVDLMDNYAAGWPYLFIGLTELIGMYWMYGVRNYYRDLNTILGFDPGFRLRSHITVVYGTVSPLLLAVSSGVPRFQPLHLVRHWCTVKVWQPYYAPAMRAYNYMRFVHLKSLSQNWFYLLQEVWTLTQKTHARPKAGSEGRNS